MENALDTHRQAKQMKCGTHKSTFTENRRITVHEAVNMSISFRSVWIISEGQSQRVSDHHHSHTTSDHSDFFVHEFLAQNETILVPHPLYL